VTFSSRIAAHFFSSQSRTMNCARVFCRFTQILLGLAVALPAHAQENSNRENNNASPQAIQHDQPSFLVRAEVDHYTRSYREGDSLSLKVVAEVDAYVYVLYQQADGAVFQIFPNASHPQNRVQARQPVQIAGGDDLFRWIVGPPFGQEVVKVIASKEPLENLSNSALRKSQFNALSPKHLKGVELELGEEPPAAWSEVELQITTHPRNQGLANTGKRRFGVFFGVSQYEFNTEKEQISQGKDKLNLPTCHRDARKLAEVLREVGQLKDAQVYTNELATRENFEKAVTGWLPSVSQPGDTVVIYFSGHGMQAADDNGDETDGRDEFLIPHDYLSVDVLAILLEKAKAGTLDPRLVPRLTELVQIIRRAGSLEKAAHLLDRRTAVSDDLFAHWLQRLDGRQVIVVLDICHAGGFATDEKDFFAPAKNLSFNFLDGEISRLKDLGQRENALLTACGAQELAAVRKQEDLSVMTHYLVDGIMAAPGSFTLEQGLEHCNATMKDYFDELNRARVAVGQPPHPGHRPYLFNYCSEPAFLKP
jgi:hypothetical protein